MVIDVALDDDDPATIVEKKSLISIWISIWIWIWIDSSWNGNVIGNAIGNGTFADFVDSCSGNFWKLLDHHYFFDRRISYGDPVFSDLLMEDRV